MIFNLQLFFNLSPILKEVTTKPSKISVMQFFAQTLTKIIGIINPILAPICALIIVVEAFRLLMNNDLESMKRSKKNILISGSILVVFLFLGQITAYFAQLL